MIHSSLLQLSRFAKGNIHLHVLFKLTQTVYLIYMLHGSIATSQFCQINNDILYKFD